MSGMQIFVERNVCVLSYISFIFKAENGWETVEKEKGKGGVHRFWDKPLPNKTQFSNTSHKFIHSFTIYLLEYSSQKVANQSEKLSDSIGGKQYSTETKYNHGYLTFW